MDQINLLWYTIQQLFFLLTDYRNYEMIDQDALYFLSGCILTLSVSTIGYFRALNQFPDKKAQRWNG